MEDLQERVDALEGEVHALNEVLIVLISALKKGDAALAGAQLTVAADIASEEGNVK